MGWGGIRFTILRILVAGFSILVYIDRLGSSDVMLGSMCAYGVTGLFVYYFLHSFDEVIH